MGMGENDGGGCQLDNHNDVVVDAPPPPKSPWKTPAASSPAVVPDSESWPALSDAPQRAKTDTKSPPPSQPEVDGSGGAPPTVQPAVRVEQQKFQGRAHMRYPRKPYAMHQQKTGPKHGPTNGASPYPMPAPYYPQAMTPRFHSMVPMSPIAPPGYTYQYIPGNFPRVDSQSVKSGSDAPSQAFVPPANGELQSSPHANSNARDSDSVGRRSNAKEQGGQSNPSWSNQRPVNFPMQPTMVPRPPYMRTPFFGPTGFVDGPIYPGPPGVIYCVPAPPSGSGRLPYPPVLVPYPFPPGVLMPPPPVIALKANLVKQIEYYFSDENLQTDSFLTSLMDNQGWVPISRIADFPRVKKMHTEIPFIIDALQASETIEIQGEMVRRRNEWSKWIGNTVIRESPSLASNAVKNDNLKENKEYSPEGIKELPLPNEVITVDPLEPDEDCIEETTNNNTDQNRNNGAELSGDRNCPAISHGNDSSKLNVDRNCRSTKVQVNSCMNDSFNDFSSTFMLDEELELEQRTVKNNHPSERVDDEDDEIMVNDQVVERLVIVTQNSGKGERPTEESKDISSEHASSMNDAIYFFEQEQKLNRSRSRLNNKPMNDGTEGSSCVVPENSNSRKKQNNKGNSKSQPIYKQRLFPGRNSRGNISDSPPSDAVGFFLGSTPPDSHGMQHLKLSASPRSNLSGSSPPVGSAPKPFPPFQHPSYKLLEDNGFKQQRYKKYRVRCLKERKKLGVGCSEEMNKLYRFWSYFLRNMFIPSIYNDFKKYALEDAAAGYNYGMECLFRFYSYGLEKEFNEELYEDFEQLTLDFYKLGNLYGLEKYWAFHHYREAKEALEKHPELGKLLREEYRSLGDFRAKNATT